MVPVGGAIVYSNKKDIIQKISEIYPGRASAGPIQDLFITLLEMGKTGLTKLIKERKENLVYLREKLIEFGKKHNERVLETKNNSISVAITLQNFKNMFENMDVD
jgi:O-phospho-L-seryl-tRNASec:L-selenocysteinyl-tRNA synthase